MTQAFVPKLSVVIPAAPGDEQYLLCCLKTLEINPPAVAGSVTVVTRTGADIQITPESLAACGVKHHAYAGTLGTALNTLWLNAEEDFLCLSHPDTLFLNTNWSGMVISSMMRREIVCFGPAVFESWAIGGTGAIQTTPEHLMFVNRQWFGTVNGFHESADGYGICALLQARMRARGMHVAGGEVQLLFAHMGGCSADNGRGAHRPVCEELMAGELSAK